MKTKMKWMSRLIVLAIIVKNLPLIVVLLAKKTWSTLTLADDTQHVKTTGDPLATTPPVTDAVIHGAASTLTTMYTGYKASPPTYTKQQVKQQRNIVITMFNKLALYIQSVARDAAIAAGDVQAGEAVVTRCGFKIKKPASKPPKFFKVLSKIVGSVDVTTKVVNSRAGYIRVYGTTPTKGTPPATLSEPIFSLETKVHIDNLKSGTIYGFREAIILPVKRNPVNPDAVITTGKTIKETASFKGNKAYFTDGAASHYIWSEWVYVVVM
jgi:hypothetical protein